MTPRQSDAPADDGGEAEDQVGAGSVSSVPPTGDNGGQATPFQLLPPLTADEYAALRDSIAAEGVRVPIQVDEDGRILDGHHRQQIADELGIDCPRIVVSNLDSTAKRTVALGLNLSRRHLNREQTRQVIASSLEADPHLSDREHARRLGVSPTTVGTVRKQLKAADAERHLLEVERWLESIEADVMMRVSGLLRSGLTAEDIVARIAYGFEQLAEELTPTAPAGAVAPILEAVKERTMGRAAMICAIHESPRRAEHLASMSESDSALWRVIAAELTNLGARIEVAE